MDKDKIISDLKKNASFSKYNITEENLNGFLIMADELENCKNCKGLKECKNSFVGSVQQAYEENGKYVFKTKNCKYRNDEAVSARGHIKTRYISDATLNASLDDFNTSTDARKKAYNYAINFVTAMKNKSSMKGLNIRGGFGSGKTYYLMALANELSKNGIDVFMIYFPDLAREIKNMQFKDELELLINDLKTTDVLMLDDLGGENLNTFLRDDVLGPVLNYRMNDDAPIFISTNLNLEALSKHFSQTKEEAYANIVDEAKGARIMKRINTLTKSLDFKDNSFNNIDKG